MKKNYAFTLIELLIVVAIIGILAAIAVPNFLCSLVKAKVARAQADLKTLSTSIEMYRLDNNQTILSLTDLMAAGIDADSLTMWSQLTTPVSYLSSNAVEDPFKMQIAEFEERYPDYVTHGVYGYNKEGKSGWRSNSIGPSQRYQIASIVVYQATNGCQSAGGIIRTHTGQLP